jgi:hypothetical protein
VSVVSLSGVLACASLILHLLANKRAGGDLRVLADAAAAGCILSLLAGDFTRAALTGPYGAVIDATVCFSALVVFVAARAFAGTGRQKPLLLTVAACSALSFAYFAIELGEPAPDYVTPSGRVIIPIIYLAATASPAISWIIGAAIRYVTNERDQMTHSTGGSGESGPGRTPG